MAFFRGIHNTVSNTVLALGFFDGIHRGHRAVLDKADKHASYIKHPLQVLTLYPHPESLVNGTDFRYITTYGEKYFVLKRYYKNSILRFIRFGTTIREMRPEEFLLYLSDNFHPEAVYIGENFRFGYQARGDAEFLQKSFQAKNISVQAVPTVQEGKEVISSSKIRTLITSGRIEKANALLGYPYFVQGVVRKGQKLGSTLGFPTANIYPCSRKLLPGRGVYAGYVQGKDFSQHALIYVGTRPTIGGLQNPVAEAYIPDLKRKNLYGMRVCLSLVAFMREEVMFSSLKELRRQISRDLETLELYLQRSSCMINYTLNGEKMGVL